MKRRFFIVALFIFAALGVWIIRTSEPRYHGRTLTSWLQQYWDASLEETQQLAEAQSAVRAIGVKKALPKLAGLVESRDDPISLWIINTGDKFRISDETGLRFIRWHSAEDFQWLGERGFEILGTNAAPAAELLGKSLNEEFPNVPEHILIIESCLESIGKPAEPVICQALTNSNSTVRQWAINQLAPVTDDVAVYITRIKPSLKDPSGAVRRTAVDAIGIQTSAPELAVPILLVALNDSVVSVNAVNALANFGTNALITFPILTNIVENGTEDTASAALKTIIVIAPNESVPILTNCIARGKPAIWGALEALRNAAPDEALPIILGRFESTDPETRRRAFRLLCLYEMTPKIESAMQIAATDSDDHIARGAKMILTDKYQNEHPPGSQFSNDPTYDGKSLAQWLNMHDRDGFLSPEATNAIYHIGTNAIVVLLQRLVYVQQPFGLQTPEGNLVHMDGVRGFIALGDQSLSAFPKLQALLDATNQDIVLYAMVATLGTGTNAIPVLSKGLTNQFADVRNEAAQSLTEGIAARFPERRGEIVSLLTNLLNDPDPDVRLNVKGDLQEINPQNIAKTETK